MSTPNRTAILNKIYKALKKQTKAHVVRGEQPLLESLLFACCLENCHYAAAEQVYDVVKKSYFDWNEIRVTSVKELAEVMAALPDPTTAGTRLKGILQSVFESEYSFDMESLKKQNLGQAIKRLQKLDGATPFIVSYATQTSLGGHSIPLDRGALGVLMVLGVINEAEAKTHSVPGLERVIPKNKGQEFGSLLHELGADFVANPYSTHLREALLAIDPDAKDRLPKRPPKKAPEPVKVSPPEKKKGAEKAVPAPIGKKKEAKETPAAKTPAVPAAKTPAPHGAKAGADSKKKSPPGKKKSPAKQLSRQKPR